MSGGPPPPRPGPHPTPVTRPFWDAAARGRLTLQHCERCEQAVFYPRSRCPRCWSDSLVWQVASGRGEVASYTVVHRPGHPAFQKEAPYVVALVDLEEGPRMLSNVVGCPPETVRVGMPVEVRWSESEGMTLPQFHPAGSDDGGRR